MKEVLLRRPSTFGELQKDVKLSPPVLSEYLKGLEKDGIIDRQAKGKRIEYYLTARGKIPDELRKQYLSIALQMIEHQTGKSLVTGMRTLFGLAEDNPQFLDGFVQWIWDLTALVTSDDFLLWAQKNPGPQGSKLMKAELRRRIPMQFQMGASPIPESASQTLVMLQNVLDAMRDVVQRGKD